MSKTTPIPYLVSLFIHAGVFLTFFLSFSFLSPPPGQTVPSSSLVEGVSLSAPKMPVSSAKNPHSPTAPSSKPELSREKSTEKSDSSSVVLGSVSGENTYFSEVQRKIQAQSRYPLEARKRNMEGIIEVEFQLNDEGRASEIHAKMPSKQPLLERSAESAVRDASPFLPPPNGVSHHFVIPIEFKIK